METAATAYIIALVLTEIYCIEHMVDYVKYKVQKRNDDRREALREKAYRIKLEEQKLAHSREELWNLYMRREKK